MSPEGRLLAVLGSKGTQSPVPGGGLCCGELNGLLGLILYKAGPLGISGLHPRQISVRGEFLSICSPIKIGRSCRRGTLRVAMMDHRGRLR